MACVAAPSLRLPSFLPQKSAKTSRLDIRCSASQINGPDDFPTMEEIRKSCERQNLQVGFQTLGPFFRVTVTNSETGREVGKAEGLIRPWVKGKILHLDSIRLKKETLGMKRSIFGLGLFLGAVAVRHGYDSGCRKAELLAINDSDVYHTKLVRFYTRMGFTPVYEVTGSSVGDVTLMLVWGGRGTRMDADIEYLMFKWGGKFKAPG